MDRLIITAMGLALIIFIAWYFFAPKLNLK